MWEKCTGKWNWTWFGEVQDISWSILLKLQPYLKFVHLERSECCNSKISIFPHEEWVKYLISQYFCRRRPEELLTDSWCTPRSRRIQLFMCISGLSQEDFCQLSVWVQFWPPMWQVSKKQQELTLSQWFALFLGIQMVKNNVDMGLVSGCCMLHHINLEVQCEISKSNEWHKWRTMYCYWGIELR